MKLKGVNPLEQHVEKIVLVVVVVILLGVIAMQFVTQPNTITVGSREVTPDAIYQVLGEQARTLESQISDTSPELPEVDDVDLVERYNRAFAASDGALLELPAPLGEGVDVIAALGVESVTPGGGNFDEIEALSVPKTSEPVAVSRWATLDPFAVSEVPELGSIGSGDQPLDFASVSIEASFSGSQLRMVLDGEDGYPGVPRLFWASTGIAVMGLEVERQKLNADGSWGRSEGITRPPLTPMPTAAVSASDPLVRLNEVVSLAQEHAADVIRPAFVPTISGPVWEPPSLVSDAQLSSLSDEDRLTRRLAALEEELDRTRNAGRRTTTSPGGGGGGKLPSRTRDPSTTTTTRPSGNNDARIERLEREIESVRDQLDRLGVDLDDRPSGRSGSAARVDVLTKDSVQMWAHDIGVEPGATYRYRTRVAVNNPYFRKGPYLDEQDQAQQALTVEPVARGDWSDWSAPVRVGAKELFFVSGASTNATTGAPAEAKVELYSMYYGYYRRRSLTLSPGDGLAIDVPISGGLLLFDRTAADAREIERYLSDTDTRNRTLPSGVRSAPDRMMIDLGAYLIEVLPDPVAGVDADGGLIRSVSVLLRSRDGELVERRPASDTASTLFEQVSASASEGARAEIRLPGSQSAAPASAGLFVPQEP